MNNRILVIQEHIASTLRMQSQLLDAITKIKPTPSVLANIRSLKKRLADLESQFLKAASEAGKDVYAMRLYAEDRQPSAAVFGESVNLYQELATVTYAAISEGKPRENSNVSEKLRNESTFGIGYTFTGSVGVVLTLSNTQGLFEDIETPIDDAIATTFAMFGSRSKEKVAEYSRQLGPGAVRALKKFTEHLVKSGFGFDAEWRRIEQVKANIEAPHHKLSNLLSIINETSTEDTVTTTIAGVLQGFDGRTKRFRITTEDATVTGEVADDLVLREWVINRTHAATIETTTTIRFSTDDTDTKVRLVRLDPLD